ncbi:MAG: hypothetical protein JXA21_22785 [Anaerolineae bacterium]|nr:hypothetical protein [Anaerolineae bacterium]
MPKSYERRYLWLCALFLVAILAIGGIRYYNTHKVLHDCMMTTTAAAWVDMNANSVWDDGEAPLKGVAFHVDDVRNGYEDVGNPSVSGWSGTGAIEVWLPGCPKTRFELYATPPVGYRLTTEARLRMGETEAKEDSNQLRFGFAPLHDTPTPTP